ncbi:cobalamin biosynthesis protein [Bacillus aquiflavi]|uniref:Cobalamin biosynthesis protein CobD n=1 Tax=Bacillus aquiflavi TaxID=2672567 RepID=A0A6B3VW49_9BACI|nr:adenosylcobinamide-phosphate synthase CbiB [Bacillus aquiflavi]MBA4536855.1 cobalamin biosynthesis protein [Bacillus aquiflavi]NEY81222.1 cobalamin biosynthesis protein [Bacillus aquiflavi]UAC48470.1 adenosylcobinamide-phosphate synthase CbiB [Bacillus aquiflavi]
MIIQHLTAITLAFIIDKIIGDPPHWPHPVRWMGRMIAFLEKSLNKGKKRRLYGFLMVTAVLMTFVTATAMFVSLLYQLHLVAGIIGEAVIISTTIAQKSLKTAAMEVYEPLTHGNLNEARTKLSYIVGRDTENLTEAEIARATIETVAENTSDGITAPLFWGLIGGAPLAVMYRVINTCDSMVGYRNERYEEFGKVSARLDDLVNWLPSRLTGFVMLMSMKHEQTKVKTGWSILFRDARRHPSPNSGWTEAAAAAIFGIQLGGKNTYKGVVSHRAKMGDPLVPIQASHIKKVNTLLERTSLLFLLFLLLGGMTFAMAYTWIKSAILI